MPRVPLSARNDPDQTTEYTALREGVPEWMKAGVTSWTRQFFFPSFGAVDTQQIERAEQYLRLNLRRTGGDQWEQAISAGERLLTLLYDDVGALDLIDYCLSTCYRHSDRAVAMQDILDRSASAWTVGADADDLACLERRVDATVEAAARAEMEERTRAATYLSKAWHSLYGRNPDPSSAHRDAARAVEASARPVVSETDHWATLGKMISALEHKPDKWVTEIGDVETVRLMMKAVWTSQHDRHGTDDESVPANVSEEEAQAAVHYAVALVHLFRTGAIRRS
ncbi:hypothetical protein [Ilumatobacter sp.]|uniref:hypothetical protein n=1 Tax=Ilumatobacter sp. TaxID=1967498 RepID=UPI003B5252D3